ncbi:MAG TPA: hypothetical protein VIL52_03950, partial [Bacteroidota bacterium]
MQQTLPPMEFDVPAFIGAIGAVQAFVIGIALLNRNDGRGISNRILGSLLITLGILSVGSLFFYTRFIFEAPNAARLHSPFNFLAPPLLYWYIRSLIDPKFRFTQAHILHLLPFVVWVGYFTPFFMLPEEEKLSILFEWFEQPTADRQFFGLSIIVQFLSYLIASFLLLARHKKQTDPPNKTSIAQLAWIRNILMLISA